MNLPVVCKRCRSEMDAHHSSSGIVVEPCDCQQGIKCDVCEMKMTDPDGWIYDDPIFYCSKCCDQADHSKYFARFPEQEEGTGPDSNERDAMMQVRVGWK